MVAGRILALAKNYGWALNLLLIAAGSYFVAGTVSTVLAQSIRKVPSASDVHRGPPRAALGRRTTKASFGPVSARNLFAAKREDLSPEPEEEVQEDSESLLGSDYKESDLKSCTVPATVRATLVAEDNPAWSMAVLYSNSTREPEVYTINPGANEIASDATLVEVRNRAVVVRRRDHFELCSADSDEKPGLPAPRATVAPTTNSDAGGVTKNSDSEYVIDKELIDNTMGNLSQVATQARIVPSFKNGKSNGFKLFSIKPGSIYQKIGLQNGDVIQKINGYDIDSPDKALEIYSKLKSARNVNIELLRRGRGMTKNYSIQ